MALPEFLLNVSTAAKLLAPPSVVSLGGSLDPDAIAKAITLADLWFTRSAVKGFDAAEFVLLTEDERRELSDAVSEFARLASTQNPKAPVSPTIRERGLILFRTILRLADPYLSKYALSPDHRRAVYALWEVTQKHPDTVVGFDFELRDDSTGEPAVFAWIIIPDEKSDLILADRGFREAIHRVKDEATEVLARTLPERWAYISLRSREEQREVIDEQAGIPEREAA